MAPPYVPYAPALAAAGVDLRYPVRDHAGSTEAALEHASNACVPAAAVPWSCAGCRTSTTGSLRRLQLAAETGDACAMLFRPATHAAQNSPAALRLKVSNSDEATYVDVLKSRGMLTTTAPLLRMRA